MRRLVPTIVLALAALCGIASLPATQPVRATDAGEGPGVRVDGQLDLCDLYVFASPEDSARTVMIVTMNPYAGLIGASTFASKATFTVNVDLDADGDAADSHTFTFLDPATDGSQSYSVAHKGRGGKYKAKGTTGALLTAPNGTKIRCGMFDDPAFVDLDGMRAGLTFSQGGSRNFFAGRNVLGIVIDIGNGEFGATSGLRVWATAARGKKQVDRVGQPCAAWLLTLAPRRDAFNAGRVTDDIRNFRQDYYSRVVTLRNANTTGVNEVVDSLLPDVLPFTPGDTRGFADRNGRRLDDDAVDLMLQFLTGDGARTDHVANDSTFPQTFPFLAPANP